MSDHFKAAQEALDRMEARDRERGRREAVPEPPQQHPKAEEGFDDLLRAKVASQWVSIPAKEWMGR